MIVVTARVHVPPQSRERFSEVTTEMCRLSREDDGCAGYRVYADLEQDDRYVLVEEWADDDALQAHFAQPHTRKFLGGARPAVGRAGRRALPHGCLLAPPRPRARPRAARLTLR